MFTVEFIVPYKEFFEIIEKAIDEYPERSQINYVMTQSGYPEIKDIKLSGDVIIARGLTATYLKKLDKLSKVFLELPMTGYDILRAIYQGITKYKAKKVAVIVTENVIYGIKNSSIPFPVDVMTYPSPLDEDTDAIVGRAIDEGADLIVGGDSIVFAAAKLNFPCSRIDAGPESIHQVLNESLMVYKEHSRAERLSALVENIDEGIIACDERKRITVCNDYVMGIFGKNSDVSLKGILISDLDASLDVPPMEDLKGPESGKLLTIDTMDFSINRIPVIIGDRFVSGVIVFQQASKIQKMETVIRSNSTKKGFVAKYTFANILGQSPLIQEARKTARNYANVNANVLIVGETGTGKEMFAQSIHNASDRRDRPFVAVNCAALPESLLESELFGYAPGAFTGASKVGKMGYFEIAHTGTIFLDEISEMPISLQGRLLRILEQREIMRIGDNQVIPVDIRIIAATNRNMEDLINKNQFRRDLFYRLDVLRLTLPPLRKIKEDIPLMVKYFLERFDKKYKVASHMMEPQVFDYLEDYNWPGNTRQLRNFCERLSTVVQSSIIQVHDVASYFGLEKSSSSSSKQDLALALSQAKNNKSLAAKKLGIDRTTLYRRMKKNNLI